MILHLLTHKTSVVTLMDVRDLAFWLFGHGRSSWCNTHCASKNNNNNNNNKTAAVCLSCLSVYVTRSPTSSQHKCHLRTVFPPRDTNCTRPVLDSSVLSVLDNRSFHHTISASYRFVISRSSSIST